MQRKGVKSRHRLVGAYVLTLMLAFVGVAQAQGQGANGTDGSGDYPVFGASDSGGSAPADSAGGSGDSEDFPVFGSEPQGASEAQGTSSGDESFPVFGSEGADGAAQPAAKGGSSEFKSFGLPTVTGLIVSNETLAAPLAEQLTKVLNEKLQSLALYKAIPNDAIKAQFKIMGPELASQCAFDPVCMGRVGRDNGINLIVVGRVEKGDSPDTWATTLDLIDTGVGQIDNFVYYTTPARTVVVQEGLDRQLHRLLRIPMEKSEGITKTQGRAQRIVGWTALALGAAAIGAGAYFATDYIQQRKAFSEDHAFLKDSDTGDILLDPKTGKPIMDITQREAQKLIDEMNQSRNLSYALIGAGVGVALTGAILVAISPGKDIYDKYESTSRNGRHYLHIAPVFTPGGMGVQGGIQF